MSKIALEGNALGSGTFTVAAPNTNTSYTLTLPQATTTVVGTDATQTLTNKTWASPASSTISSATAQASTSGTSIDFTGIPSWVKRITVMWNGVSTNGSSSPLVQLGDSGGIETTGYGGSGSLIASTVTTQNYTTGFGERSQDAAAVRTGSWTITNVSGNIWVCAGVLGRSDAAITSVTGGTKTLSDTLTQVRITTVNGTDTFDAGSINILFE
jgi:hypothetical protein